MAQIPVIKNFRPEDYENLDAKFASNLNIITEAVVNALSGNLNFTNIAGDIYSRQIINKNTTISASSPLRLPWIKSLPPAAVTCGGIWRRGADSSTSLGLTIFVEWDYDSSAKQLIIKKINGLTLPDSTYDYEITLLCYCK